MLCTWLSTLCTGTVLLKTKNIWRCGQLCLALLGETKATAIVILTSECRLFNAELLVQLCNLLTLNLRPKF